MKSKAALFVGVALLAGCSLVPQRTPSVYMVFFGSGNTELSEDAHSIVRAAATGIRSRHPASVMIAAGIPTADNLKLAEPRFNAVRQALIAEGVAPDLIARSAISDVTLKTGRTGDQRVEIRLGSTPQP